MQASKKVILVFYAMYKKCIEAFEHIGQVWEHLAVFKSPNHIKENVITLNMDAFQMGEKMGICQLTISGTFPPDFT